MSEALHPIEVKEALMQFKVSEPIQGRLLLYPAIGKNAFQTKPKVEEQQLKNAAENPVIDKKVYQDMTDLSEAERNELWQQKKEEWERQEAEKKRNDATYIEKRFNAAELWRENFKKNAAQGSNKSFVAFVSAKLRGQPVQANYELTNDEIQYFYSTFLYDRSTKTKQTIEVFVSKMDDLYGVTYATLPDETKNSMLWLARQLFGGDVSGEMIMQLSDLHIKQKRSATPEEKKSRASDLIEKSKEPTDADQEKLAKVRHYLNIRDHIEPDIQPKPGRPLIPAPSKTDNVKNQDEITDKLKSPAELAEEIVRPIDPNEPIVPQMEKRETIANQTLHMAMSMDHTERNTALEIINLVIAAETIETINDKSIIVDSDPSKPIHSSIQAQQLSTKNYILEELLRQTNPHFIDLPVTNTYYLTNLLSLLQKNSDMYNNIGDGVYTAQRQCMRLQDSVLRNLSSVAENNPEKLAVILFERSEVTSFLRHSYNTYHRKEKNQKNDSYYYSEQIEIVYLLYEKLLEKGYRKNMIQLIRSHPDLAEIMSEIPPFIGSNTDSTPHLVEVAELIEELPTSIHDLSIKMGADTAKEQHITETVWQLAEEEGLTEKDIQLLLSNYQEILSAQPVSSVTDLADPALAQYLYNFEKKYFKSLNGENTAVLASRAYVLMQLYPELETSAYKLDFTTEQLQQIKVITELIRLINK